MIYFIIDLQNDDITVTQTGENQYRTSSNKCLHST